MTAKTQIQHEYKQKREYSSFYFNTFKKPIKQPNFLRKMDQLKILQWNCRGLNNKISDLILFSAEENIDVICLNEVQKRKKSTALNNYIFATETCNNGHLGSAILVKNSVVIKQTEPVEKETDSNV